MTIVQFKEDADGLFIDKSPGDVRDYGFSWLKWLQDGETILASNWNVPAGITEEDTEFSGMVTKVWLSGGVVGQTYLVTNHIVTNSSPIHREKDLSFRINVRNG